MLGSTHHRVDQIVCHSIEQLTGSRIDQATPKQEFQIQAHLAGLWRQCLEGPPAGKPIKGPSTKTNSIDSATTSVLQVVNDWEIPALDRVSLAVTVFSWLSRMLASTQPGKNSG